tara:strand:+ start:427 stop:1563 length:1137 start_codon:yes stop_codon:yes gene_type:complete
LILEYFNSVEKNTLDFANNLNVDQLGKKIGINGRDDYNEFSNINIIIFSISEYRHNQSINKKFNADKDFRKKLYSLYIGNWTSKIYDMGSLVNGNKISDTNYALEKIINSFVKNQIFVITVGGSQNLTTSLYSSIKPLLSSINLVSINNKLDFTKNNNTEESYLSRIILDDENKLNQFSNIGYQKHLISQDEIGLINKMKFESLSLGKVKSDVNNAEPVLRDSNLTSFDIRSVKSGDINNAHQYPNGLTTYEFCSLSRFSGSGSKSKVVSFFENWDFSIMNSLLAEAVWYVIDGFNSRFDENPEEDSDDFVYYHIELDNYKFKFYKSLITDKWWVEFINDELISVEKNIISCTANDYYQSKNSIISKRILTRLKNKIT